MAKYNLENFIQKVSEKHGDIYDFSESIYNGLDKEISYKCPTHGLVKQVAKKVLTHSGCPLCDQEKAKNKRKSGSYQKNKGNRYELKIIKELTELGFKGLVSARSQSKRLDNAKVDIAETEDSLPFYAQIKCTKVTPNYFGISEECPLKDKPFVIFWNRQELAENQIDMCSRGEVVILPKEYFYKLISS